MLPALLAVLSLAGAPQATSVTCDPAIPTGELGVTLPAYLTVENGAVVGRGPLQLVRLGTVACGALLYASASPAERAAIRRLNPGVNFPQLLGVGLQVALHEAEHAALDSTNECQVEKATRAKVDGLISSLDPADAAQAQAQAATSDASLPAAYHGC